MSGKKINSPEKFTPKTVNAKNMKVLSEKGLLAQKTEDYTNNLLAVCLDPAAIKEVCDALFEESITAYEELDLRVFHQGIKDFLLPFFNPSLGLAKSTKTSG